MPSSSTGQQACCKAIPTIANDMEIIPAERTSVYLASKSPRREELLRQLGVDFTLLLLREAAERPRDIVETPRKDEPPFEYVKRVARTKASVGWHQMGRRGLAPKPVLAADTEVVLDGAVLGKPKDAMSAVDMLRRLSALAIASGPAGVLSWSLASMAQRSTARATSSSIVEFEPPFRRPLIDMAG